jgi:hypothetical protein
MISHAFQTTVNLATYKNMFIAHAKMTGAKPAVELQRGQREDSVSAQSPHLRLLVVEVSLRLLLLG